MAKKKKPPPPKINYKGFRVLQTQILYGTIYSEDYPTDPSKKEYKNSMKVEAVMKAGRNARKFGQCPICWKRHEVEEEREGLHGLTCGGDYCRHRWLFPNLDCPHPPPKDLPYNP